MEIEKTTREEAARPPLFKSHAESRKYFKSKYGIAFQLEDSFVVEEDAEAIGNILPTKSRVGKPVFDDFLLQLLGIPHGPAFLLLVQLFYRSLNEWFFTMKYSR